MALKDADLLSIQEVRDLVAKAKAAQQVYQAYSQEQVNQVCQAVADAGVRESQRLAQMAQEETGFGKAADKTLKNIFASKIVNDTYKGTKTVGILDEDPTNKTIDVAVPVGVIAGLIPSTNPTSSVFYKAIIALKAGNAIVFSPHPNASKCIAAAIQVVREALEKVGAPVDLVSGMTILTLEATDELMKHPDTRLILATGGGAMVKAAYSSGTPALGVGPGNGPAFIEKSANVNLAVKRIMDSKTFDNGTICASEQSIVVEKVKAAEVEHELTAQGGYFMSAEEKEKVAEFIMRSDNTMNPAIVGKSPQQIAKLADIQIPDGTRVLIARDSIENIGHADPYSREKLTPLLAYYVVDSYEEAVETANKLLSNEGAGHTAIIHSEDQQAIKDYGVRVYASRVLVNTPGALGGIGASTELKPALTLGCGAVGGSATSDNVSPLDLIDIKRIAVGVRELSEIREDAGVANCTATPVAGDEQALIESIVRQVLKEIY